MRRCLNNTNLHSLSQSHLSYLVLKRWERVPKGEGCHPRVLGSPGIAHHSSKATNNLLRVTFIRASLELLGVQLEFSFDAHLENYGSAVLLWEVWDPLPKYRYLKALIVKHAESGLPTTLGGF